MHANDIVWCNGKKKVSVPKKEKVDKERPPKPKKETVPVSLQELRDVVQELVVQTVAKKEPKEEEDELFVSLPQYKRWSTK